MSQALGPPLSNLKSKICPSALDSPYNALLLTDSRQERQNWAGRGEVRFWSSSTLNTSSCDFVDHASLVLAPK